MKLAKLKDKPEIFYSIQGEGKSMGKPSIFIRLSLCNLYCIWCDTDYTWNWEKTKYPHRNDSLNGYNKFKKKEYIQECSTVEILRILSEIDCRNIIITGGEPMVQHKELFLVLTELKKYNQDYTIEMETNGTLVPTESLDELIDQYNVSIKLSNSKVKTNERLVDGAISFFSKSIKSNFKFVVDNVDDLEEILAIKNNYKIASNNIYLMPQGTTVAGLNEKQIWLVEICKKHGFNYTDRLHIHIFGDKRGV